MSQKIDHQKPNIVLIMTDQQRADTIAELGHPWMQTPNLDRLVKQGMSFTNCFVTSPVCVSSRASVFLGAYPHTPMSIQILKHGSQTGSNGLRR